MKVNNEIKICGSLVRELLEKHYNKSLIVTAVMVNDDVELIKSIDNFDIYIEEIKELKKEGDGNAD